MGKKLNARERRKARRAFALGACNERRNATRLADATPYVLEREQEPEGMPRIRPMESRAGASKPYVDADGNRHFPRNTKRTSWTFLDKKGNLPKQKAEKDTGEFKPDEKGFMPFDEAETHAPRNPLKVIKLD